ncbi:MAG: GHKL domain-containing protein [Lachnospiraceae bacterium]|nr:GHKL domain-containing protein [Lachnospiraceae bacterium]
MIEQDIYKMMEWMTNVVEANLLLLFVGIFLAKSEIIFKRKIIIGWSIGMGTVCYILDHAGIISVWKTVVLLMAYMIIAYIIYRRSVTKTVLWTILYTAVFSPVEVMIIFILRYLSGKELELFFNWSAERVYALVVIKIVEVFIVILCYRMYQSDKEIRINDKLIRIIIVTGILVIFMTMLFVMNHLTGQYEEMVTMAYFVFAVGLVLFLVYTMFSVTERVEKQKELELIQLHNKILRQSLSETKNAYMRWEKSIHDYKNTIICLDSMLKEKDTAAVREYLNQEMEQIQSSQHFIDVGNDMVNSILSVKLLEAEQRRIHFSVQGKIEHPLSITEIHLGRLLGNLIDNAIEGAENSTEKPFVEVEIYQNQKLLCINISNSTGNGPIDFSKSRKEKSGMHGIGLKSVREKVAEYQGIFHIEQLSDIVEARVQIPLF